MKAGGLYAAIAVLAILGGTIWWFNKHPTVDKTATVSTSLKLTSADPAQITAIRIAKAGSDAIELAKVSDVWQIKEPRAMPADSEAVSPLTGSLGSITADRVIDEHPSSLAEFGLVNPPEEVDFTLKNGKTTKLLLGSDSPTGSSTYAKVEGDPKVYVVSSTVKNDLSKGLNDLREKRLMTFNQNKIKSVTLAAKGAPMEFATSPDTGWHLVKPANVRADPVQVDDLVRRLVDARLDPAASDDQIKLSEMFGAGKKVAAVTATDDRGTESMEVRKGNDNSYYAKSSAIEGYYKINNDIGDGLDKSIEDFRNKKLFDFGFGDVTKLEAGGQTYEKSGDKWTANGVQMDPNTIQDVIDKLRDLTATKLTGNMTGVKTLALAVTSGDKHHVEKVVINKASGEWDAQREGEPTVYVLDAKPVDELQKTIAAIKQYQPPKTDGKKK